MPIICNAAVYPSSAVPQCAYHLQYPSVPICSASACQCTYRFLKGTLGQSAGLVAVEALSGDGGQVTFTGHDLTQQHQVAPVDVAPIKGDHVQQFLFDGLAGSLNAQCLWREKRACEEQLKVLWC